jgi:hypothetical protein
MGGNRTTPDDPGDMCLLSTEAMSRASRMLLGVRWHCVGENSIPVLEKESEPDLPRKADSCQSVPTEAVAGLLGKSSLGTL